MLYEQIEKIARQIESQNNLVIDIRGFKKEFNKCRDAKLLENPKLVDKDTVEFKIQFTKDKDNPKLEKISRMLWNKIFNDANVKKIDVSNLEDGTGLVTIDFEKYNKIIIE